MTHYPIKPNLQESTKNEDGSYNIPSIVNGVTSENFNLKLAQNDSDSIDTGVDNLKQNIILCNKDEQAILKKTQNNSYW